MQVGEHVAELARDVDDEALGQRTAASRNLLFEVTALDVLHHEIVAILGVEAVGDRGDRGVLELSQGIGFAGEVVVGLDSLLRIDEVIDHLLDRAGTIGQALVMGQVDHPHPAAAEQAFDLVAVLQNRTGRQRLVGQSPGCSSIRHQSANTTITETLSVPPPAFAATTNSRAAAFGSS